MNQLAVELSQITKRFGSFTALDAVDLRVAPQTLHAVVGENGAGKTTLMRVLQGTYRPDGGTVTVAGQTLDLASAEDGYRHGIGMVSQHYSIIPELSCIENLVLGGEPGSVIDWNAAKTRANGLAEKLGLSFEWDSPARELSPAGAQKLEILKLLWRNSRVMILDEPTAMLGPADAEALYSNLREFVEEGATVIVVTHRLPEVMDHCDEITVLRGGKLVAHRRVSETTISEVAELIVGRSLAPLPEREPVSVEQTALDVKNLKVRGARGEEAVKSASFRLAAGEIVGIAGVDGNGQQELFHALMGRIPAELGTVELFGQEIGKRTLRDRIDAGLRLIPEDRHHEAVVEDWSLTENALLGYQRRAELVSRQGIRFAALREFARSTIDRFQAKATGIGARMGSLSGGNQQRVVAARALSFSPRLILAFQPTRGLDIAATQDVYQAIRECCQGGAAALVVSFDLDELLTFCDRVVVMNHGRLTVPAAHEERDRTRLGQLMVAS